MSVVLVGLALILSGCTTQNYPEKGIYSDEEISMIYAGGKGAPSFNSKVSEADRWNVNEEKKIAPRQFTVLTRYNYMEEGRVPIECRSSNQGVAGKCFLKFSEALLKFQKVCESQKIPSARHPDCEKQPVVRALQYAKLGKVLILLNERDEKRIKELLEE